MLSLPCRRSSWLLSSNPFTRKARKPIIPATIEPVQIKITRHHEYKKGTRGCQVCKGAKYAPQHLGHSESVNSIIGGGHFIYQSQLKGWKEAICLALVETELPKPCSRIYVQGTMCFPRKYNKGPDQGNHRFIVEKAMGDALENGYGYSTGSKKKGTYEWHQVIPGGWVKNDDWKTYEFSDLAYEMRPGESWTHLIISYTT